MGYCNYIGYDITLDNKIQDFFFHFNTHDQMMQVFKGGPWHFAQRPLFLRSCEPGMVLAKDAHSSIPVWVKFFNALFKYWSSKGFLELLSSLGKSIHADALTKERKRLGFARIYIEMHVSYSFPPYIELY